MVMSRQAERSGIQFHRLLNVLITDPMFMVIYHFMEKHLAATMNDPAQATPLITCSDIVVRRANQRFAIVLQLF